MGISFNPNISFRRAELSQHNVQNKMPVQSSMQDVFVRTDNSSEYLKRLEELFPHGEIKDIYTGMCNELELDYPPYLVFETGAVTEAGGGYSFINNRIDLNLPDILDSNYKIIGIKGDEKEILVDTKTMVPLFINKSIAGLVVKNPKNAVVKGYDKLIAEPITEDEQRKLFIMKLRHELVHAKQHMIMRQTEGIGAKAVIKAWRHIPPNNSTPKYIMDQIINAQYQKSYWADKPDIIKYKKSSPTGDYAIKCLDAVQNYPPVVSPLYTSNFIEAEAYRESNDYITKLYGEWNND